MRGKNMYERSRTRPCAGSEPNWLTSYFLQSAELRELGGVRYFSFSIPQWIMCLCVRVCVDVAGLPCKTVPKKIISWMFSLTNWSDDGQTFGMLVTRRWCPPLSLHRFPCLQHQSRWRFASGRVCVASTWCQRGQTYAVRLCTPSGRDICLKKRPPWATTTQTAIF